MYVYMRVDTAISDTANLNCPDDIVRNCDYDRDCVGDALLILKPGFEDVNSCACRVVGAFWPRVGICDRLAPGIPHRVRSGAKPTSEMKEPS